MNVQPRGAAPCEQHSARGHDRAQAEQIPLEVKLIYEESSFLNGSVWSPAENYIEGSGMGPELFIFVEWVRSPALEEMQAAAAEIGLECNLHDGKATIYGYR